MFPWLTNPGSGLSLLSLMQGGGAQSPYGNMASRKLLSAD
jgi:hypothetical protein